MRWSIVGTTNVWDTRCSSTARSHDPASKRGRTTSLCPACRLISSPSVPPMWKIGADIMSVACGASGSTAEA